MAGPVQQRAKTLREHGNWVMMIDTEWMKMK